MTINLQMIGRFGNQCFQYAHARALAERDGAELRTPRWDGEKVFEIEQTAEPDYSGDYLHGYFQNQESAIYTREQIRSWFKFRPWVHVALRHLILHPSRIVAHSRRTDFEGYGYPIVSTTSYHEACDKFGLDSANLCFVCDSVPTAVRDVVGWLPDFYIMATCETLLRANSSFSWWASAIGGARTFSPVIDGATAGECDVEFVEGNHPKLFSGDGFTDIHLK